MKAHKPTKDPIGDRMKSKYEDPFRFILPQRSHLLIRIDGRAFHTYTKKFSRPFDSSLHDAMTTAALEVMKEIGGVKFGFGQSDEYSFVATDFDTHESQMWFGGNKAKIESITASIFTAAFNRAIWEHHPAMGNAYFDARAFIIPMAHEVVNYFVWRQQDTIRNSVSMLARHRFSAKKLHGVSTHRAKQMLNEAGLPWKDQPSEFRRGTALYKPDNDTPTGWYVDRDLPLFSHNPSFVARHLPEGD